MRHAGSQSAARPRMPVSKPRAPVSTPTQRHAALAREPTHTKQVHAWLPTGMARPGKFVRRSRNVPVTWTARCPAVWRPPAGGRPRGARHAGREDFNSRPDRTKISRKRGRDCRDSLKIVVVQIYRRSLSEQNSHQSVRLWFTARIEPLGGSRGVPECDGAAVGVHLVEGNAHLLRRVPAALACSTG